MFCRSHLFVICRWILAWSCDLWYDVMDVMVGEIAQEAREAWQLGVFFRKEKGEKKRERMEDGCGVLENEAGIMATIRWYYFT